ncbi:hypothetical protein R1flu_015694 [Riccia fluitans]|uniref:BHLH domain-containing protein n=1 Tax=Riccia fluitans TaxID=41844 RepID=A0ABD1YJP2_9MARC
MMAHNLSAHSLTSALNHRSSSTSFLSNSHQDHHQPPVRQISVLSMPDILEVFNHSQAAASATTSLSSSCVRNPSGDPCVWELPELKWLDQAENIAAAASSECLPSACSPSTLAPPPIEGERWSTAFSSLYPRDRVLEGAQLISPQSIVGGASSGSSGSSALMKGRMDISSSGSREFPSSSSQIPPITRSLRGSIRRPADSEFAPEKLSNSKAEELPKTQVPGNDGSGLLTSTSYPPKKRSRTTGAAARGDGESSGHDPKMGKIEKGSVSGTNNQTASPERDSKKTSATTTVSDHEIHIWTERERRKKMNGMFSTLHSLLPHLTSKADKSTIVDEAINYIQSLEVTMKGLMKRKSEMPNSSNKLTPTSLSRLQALQHGKSGKENNVSKVSPTISFCGEKKPPRTGSSSPANEAQFQTQCSKNVVLNMCGNDAFITVCSPRGRLGLLCRVLFVLESHNLHVINAHICTSNDTIMYMVHAKSEGDQLVNTDKLNIALQEIMKSLTPHNS